MNLTFPANESTEFAFRIGINGTDDLPSAVIVVLERDGFQLSYSADKKDDEWVVSVENPGSMFCPGEVNFWINVLVSKRLFTPVIGVGHIVGEEQPVDVPVKSQISIASDDLPTQSETSISGQGSEPFFKFKRIRTFT